MRKSLVRRPSPALVLSFIALLVAMGGTAYAGLSIPKNSVGTKQLKNGAVSTSKLKNGAVTAAKLNVSGVTVPNSLNAGTAASAVNATNATNATNASNLTGAGWGLVNFNKSLSLSDGHNATVTHMGGADSGTWCISVPGADAATTPIILTNEYDNDDTLVDATTGQSSGVEWDAAKNFVTCPAGQYGVITYGIHKGTGSGLDTFPLDDSFSFFVP